MTNPNESILKIDRQGRLRYSSHQRSTMVDAYFASGLSAPRFAVLYGVNYQTLVYWIKKSKTNDSADSIKPARPTSLSFVAAEFDPPPLTSGTRDALEILLPGGAKILINSPKQVSLCMAIIREFNHSQPC
jgi:hypothetical protein